MEKKKIEKLLKVARNFGRLLQHEEKG